MWNRIVRVRRSAALALVLGFGLVLMLGCDGAKNSPSDSELSNTATAQKIEGGLTPADPSAAQAVPPKAMDIPAILGEISVAKDMLMWFQVRSTYQGYDSSNREIDAALLAKENELLAQAPAKPVSDALDLLDFDWKLVDAESTAGEKETFRATWLFRASKDISLEPGHDVLLVMRGWIDTAHQQYFDNDERYFELTYTPKPSFANWKAGEYRLISYKTYKKIPNVPYRIHTLFPETKKTAEGKTVTIGRYGGDIDSGWHVDVGKAAMPASAS